MADGIRHRLTLGARASVPSPPLETALTLGYMAPEQTGRLNRSIDCRSKLYALGVIFCQIPASPPTSEVRRAYAHKFTKHAGEMTRVLKTRIESHCEDPA